MIQDVKFVRQRNAGLFEVLERPHDIAVFHVPSWIVIGTDDQDARMPADGGLNQQMQIAEIIVVFGQQNQTVLDGMQQMARIPGPERAASAG
jgi:hypothetical protein